MSESLPPPPTSPIKYNDDLYVFGDKLIMENIRKMSDNDIYTVVTGSSLELLARRIRYFKQLHP
jgi:hypothetical protein